MNNKNNYERNFLLQLFLTVFSSLKFILRCFRKVFMAKYFQTGVAYL